MKLKTIMFFIIFFTSINQKRGKMLKYFKEITLLALTAIAFTACDDTSSDLLPKKCTT